MQRMLMKQKYPPERTYLLIQQALTTQKYRLEQNIRWRTEVSAAGEVGAIGVLLSACTIVIDTELATSANNVTKDNHPLRNRLFIVSILSSKI